MSKRYIEFWHKGIMTGEPIPACGSDSFAYLDARLSDRNQREQAAQIARKRGYIGYRIMAYPILPERALTGLILLDA